MKTHPHHLASTSLRRAFTLMEMILVLSIIALLIGIGAATFTNVGDTSGTVAVRAQINTISSSVELYKVANRNLPPNIDALVKPPSNVPVKTPFMEPSGIMDPWGQKYIYKSPGRDGKRFEIYSLGPDGKDGTGDDVTKDS
jgi:general secretion pathway protein G